MPNGLRACPDLLTLILGLLIGSPLAHAEECEFSKVGSGRVRACSGDSSVGVDAGVPGTGQSTNHTCRWRVPHRAGRSRHHLGSPLRTADQRSPSYSQHYQDQPGQHSPGLTQRPRPAGSSHRLERARTPGRSVPHRPCSGLGPRS